ncbi:tripartite tricarboxylate transporter substrate binding protein [Pigmentiphaga soli]|uniref:Tripartite tricarboxylate transporter substrate binding protein n=2 Tax=Pigmentiphaga soli TaxID=1007095 RepID=A0ABP8GQC9_9BURK
MLAAAAAPAAAAFARGAAAQDTWPSKPIRFVLPFAAGGSADVIARNIAQKLSPLLGQPIVVDNRTGAGGAIGTAAVARAEPDGYTWLMVNNNTLIFNIALYPKLSYDPLKDFTHVAEIATVPMLLVVNPSLPVKTLPEFIAYAKAHPGKLNYGTAGVGSGGHIATAYFASAAGVELTHVPYQGSSGSLPDLLGGRLQLTMTGSGALPYVRNGQLRALAVTSAKRVPYAPDVPTVAETLPGFEFVLWYGLSLPAGTPAPIAQRINRELAKVMAMPDIVEGLSKDGTFPAPSASPEAFTQYVKDEIGQWVPILKKAGITQA